MTYAIYKGARNSSWKCLVDCGVIGLPIKPVQIAACYGIKCKKTGTNTLNHASGEIRIVNNEICIFVDKNYSSERKRFTIMHELGHYLLGNLGDTPLSRNHCSIRSEEEQAADRFAADILMPACVLWRFNIHTPEEISQLCNVSMPAATIRADRMEILYRRNKFLLHPLENQVFQQFQRFINNRKGAI